MADTVDTVSTALSYVVSGNMSGIIGVFFSHPFDTVRIRMQVGNTNYKSAWHCAASTVRKEGARALFRGVMPPMIGLGFQNAALFGVYGPTLELIHAVHGVESSEREKLSHVFIAGCAGGTAQTLICTPMELLKIRMQLNRGKSMAVIKSARRIIKHEGIFTMYRGFLTTVVRDCPSYGVWFYVYEASKRYFIDSRGWGGPLAPVSLFFAGGFAGVCAWACIYPVDVIKSRLQSSATATVRSCIKDSYREGGWRSFFVGFNPTMVKGFVCSGVTFVAVEAGLLVTEWIDNHWRRAQ